MIIRSILYGLSSKPKVDEKVREEEERKQKIKKEVLRKLAKKYHVAF